MNNIIIFGAPRSGKSTLANMIADKWHYQIIRVDTLRDTFTDIYPELNITSNTAFHDTKFQLFLQDYFRRSTDAERNKYGYILEGCETSVADCNRLFNTSHNIIYYLAPVNISPTEFFNNIRQHDSNTDWTAHITDAQLLEYAADMIAKGHQFQSECAKYHIPFADTSHHRPQVLSSVLADIERRMSA